MLKVAQEYKRKVNFAVSNKEEYGGEIEQAGLGDRKDSDKPIAVLYTEAGKYPMDQAFRYCKHFRVLRNVLVVLNCNITFQI